MDAEFSKKGLYRLRGPLLPKQNQAQGCEYPRCAHQHRRAAPAETGSYAPEHNITEHGPILPGGWPTLSGCSFKSPCRGCPILRRPCEGWVSTPFATLHLILVMSNDSASTERQVSGHDFSAKAEASESEQNLRSRAVKRMNRHFPYAVGRRAPQRSVTNYDFIS